MATIKSYSDLEQSRKLTEILPRKSADMHYTRAHFEGNKSDWFIGIGKPIKSDDIIPAWSLSALLSVLPEIQGGKPAISLDDNYITYPHMSDLHTKADNLIDACYEIIIKLNELKML